MWLSGVTGNRSVLSGTSVSVREQHLVPCSSRSSGKCSIGQSLCLDGGHLKPGGGLVTDTSLAQSHRMKQDYLICIRFQT